MDLQLAGRRVLVTAASKGLGYACARRLAEEGAQVVICSRSQESVEAAARSIGRGAIAIAGDHGTLAGVQELYAEALDRLGGLDVLVANTGGPPPSPWPVLDTDELKAVMESHGTAQAWLCSTAAAEMARGGHGRIVLVLSAMMRSPVPTLLYGSMARSALLPYVNLLARTHAGSGVTVNSLLPGLHATDRLRNNHPDRSLDELGAGLPTGRIGDPDDFGAVAAFLCSPYAAQITGQQFVVDGGEGL